LCTDPFTAVVAGQILSGPVFFNVKYFAFYFVKEETVFYFYAPVTD